MPVKALAPEEHHPSGRRMRLIWTQTWILSPKSSLKRRHPDRSRKRVIPLLTRVSLVGASHIHLARQEYPASASVKTRWRATTGQHLSIGLGCFRLHQVFLLMYCGLVDSLGSVSPPWTKFLATNMRTCSPILFGNVMPRATRLLC